MMYKYLLAYNKIVWKFYAHSAPPLSNHPSYSLLREPTVPFRRQEILKVILIQDILEEKPSFSDIVNDTPIGSPAFEEICSNYSDQAIKTGYIKSGLLKKQLVLVFLFSKYNITQSSVIAELHSRDAVLMNWILRRHPFDIASILYTSILQCMGQDRDCIQDPRMTKSVLVLSSIII